MDDTQTLLDFDEIVELGKAMKTPVGKKELYADVDNLSRRIFAVDYSFRKISNPLTEVQVEAEEKEVEKVVLDKVQDLVVTWSKHHQEFMNVCLKSRRDAGNAMRQAQFFSEDFLPDILATDDQVSLEEKKEAIKEFADRIEKDETQAWETSRAFKELASAVLSFQNRWSTVISRYNLGTLSPRKNQLDNDISELENVLKQLQTRVSSLSNISDAMEVGGGVSSLIGVMCPGFWAGAAVGALGNAASRNISTSLNARLTLVQNMLKEMREARASIQAATEGTVQALQYNLEDAATDFKLIQVHLSVFTSLWSALRMDLQLIQGRIDEASTAYNIRKLRARLEGAKELYDALRDVLERYQLADSPEQLDRLKAKSQAETVVS